MSKSNKILENNPPNDNGKNNRQIFGQPLQDPILGKHFKLPDRGPMEQTIKFDTSLSVIPVYSHLKIYDAEILKRPPTPPAIKRIENEDYMDFHTPSKTLPKVSNASSLKVNPVVANSKEGREKKLEVPNKHF